MRMMLVALIAAIAMCALRATDVQAEPIDFVRDVRPLLEKHCYACHAADEQKSSLRLDIKSEAFKGGEAYGPSIVAGNSAESPLIQFISDAEADVQMPPEGERLSAAEIALLKQWVDDGANWPDGVDLASLVDRRDHWSFKPLAAPQPPATKQTGWARSAIDQFVLARLENESLRPAPEADRVTWLRRVSFDLTGLPPEPRLVETFLADRRGDAYKRVVEELLASPRYGERWAQHWLDVVRYADTHGFEVNTERPHAWPYRDYVIDAFNRDTPFDRFIREQIVGDVLQTDAATGFLITASVLLPGQIGKDEPSIRLARQDSLDEIVVNVGQTFLGLSVGCARCHDHKFDPISQRDYYAMQALVAGVEYEDRELHTPEAEARRAEAVLLKSELSAIDRQLAGLVPLANSGVERAAVSAGMNTDRFASVTAKRLRFTVLTTNRLEPCLDELEVFNTTGSNVALASAGTSVKSSGDTVVANVHQLSHVNDGSYGNTRSWMSNEVGQGWVELEFAEPQTIDRVTWGRDRQGQYQDRLALNYRIEICSTSADWQRVADASDRKPYRQDVSQPASLSTAGLTPAEAQLAERLEAEKKSLAERLAKAASANVAFVGKFRVPDEIHLLTRGDPEQPKDQVVPAVLSAFDSIALAKDAPDPERRLTLANWIASPENPLTYRVIVNRIWQGHFGTGLVDTPSDFGWMGSHPSHPELLDWLATEFIRTGYSVKQMHRLIVLSSTYRQSTQHDAPAAAKDADVRLLWRFPARRLEAEAIRDSMLAVSGKLEYKMGGPGFNLFDQRGGLSGFVPVESYQGDGLRRLIYAHKVRREREAVFGAFDCPDAGQSTARRRESTTPIQALNLFNSQFTIEQAAAFAARVQADVGNDVDLQVRRAYQLAIAREPRDVEAADARSVAVAHGLSAVCRALFNSNEFLSLP